MEEGFLQGALEVETGSLSLVTGTQISGHREGKPRVFSNCGESCLGGGGMRAP